MYMEVTHSVERNKDWSHTQLKTTILHTSKVQVQQIKLHLSCMIINTILTTSKCGIEVDLPAF